MIILLLSASVLAESPDLSMQPMVGRVISSADESLLYFVSTNGWVHSVSQNTMRKIKKASCSGMIEIGRYHVRMMEVAAPPSSVRYPQLRGSRITCRPTDLSISILIEEPISDFSTVAISNNSKNNLSVSSISWVFISNKPMFPENVFFFRFDQLSGCGGESLNCGWPPSIHQINYEDLINGEIPAGGNTSIKLHFVEGGSSGILFLYTINNGNVYLSNNLVW
jgi:hypothetical protein